MATLDLSDYIPEKDLARATTSGAGALYYWIFPNFMLNIYPSVKRENGVHHFHLLLHRFLTQ